MNTKCIAIILASLVLGWGSHMGFTYFMPSMSEVMIDHISIAVDNYPKSLEFYDATLAELGYERLMTLEHQRALYGSGKRPAFSISASGNPQANPHWQLDEVGRARGLHIAFRAPSRKHVDAWYERALELGAEDNGAPGIRSYHPDYYAAFVIDPSGWRLEAVCHT